MEEIFDVIVVGSGPAGATAAIHLARDGRRVCLVEKDSHPRYKVCGGGLLARALPLLPVSPQPVVEQECFCVQMNIWGKNLSFRGERNNPIIYMVMRPELDALLVDEARKCGVVVMENTLATDLAQKETHVSVLTDRGPLRGRYLIAADGVSSVMALKAGWPANDGAIASMECEVAVDRATLERFSGVARFDIDHPARGYSWIFPKREHLSVGSLSVVRDGKGLRESIRDYLECLGIVYSPPLKLRGAMIPVSPRPGLPAKGRVLLVGDAAGLAEPICAEGITNSLRSGILAAKAIAAGGDDQAMVRDAYLTHMGNTVFGELKTAAAHSRVLYGNSLVRNAMFRIRGERFCNRLIDIMTGEKEFATLGGPLRQLLN